jgi:hypothetical protein
MAGEKIHTIVETFSPNGVRRALSGTYSDWRPALLELTDNSVDARLPGKPLSINVIAGKDSLLVSDRGGKGMDLEGLKRLMNWGESTKGQDDIGQYGVGGKAAMGYLGRRLHIACSADGSSSRFDLEITDWQRSSGALEIREGQTAVSEGFVVAEMSRPKNYNPKRMTPEAIAGLLGSVYRPMLASGEVQMWVGRSMQDRIQVAPLGIPYDIQTPELAPETLDLQTGRGEMIRVSVGVVNPKDFAQSEHLKPGMRVYYRERLIIDGFYAGINPSHLPNLIGEMHIKNATVLTNKTGFATDDPNWRDSVDVLKLSLQAWENKLEGKKQEDPRLADERRLAESAKRDLEAIFADSGLITEADITGESRGGKSSTVDPGGEKGSGGGKGRSGGEVPPGGENKKKWGVLFKWDLVSFGRSEPQAEIYYADLGPGGNIVNGKDSRLRINTDHPSYERARQRDSLALREYFTHTAAYHVLMDITRSSKGGDLGYFHHTHQSLTARISEYYLKLSKGDK